MAKIKKRKEKIIEEKGGKPEKNIFSVLENFLNSWKGNLVFIFVAGAILSTFYAPMAFQGKKPEGVDVLASMGKNHQLSEYRQTHDDQALWNPYIFGGMPVYHRLNPVVFSLDTLFIQMGKMINTHFLLFIFGALGIFLLLKYLKINAIWAFLLGLVFILWPHFHALIIVGHFMKFRALMYLPWVFLTFIYLLNSPSILSMALFGFLFTVQMRTQHYQIIFYGLLLMFIVGMFKLIEYIREKEYQKIYKISGYLGITIILTVLSIAQPTFIMKEYAEYSTRGGNAINIYTQENAADQKGVGIDYAVGWSLSPAEILDLVIPRFHGGSSLEVYDGNAIPRLSKGTKLGNVYWGEMPFTQSYEYFGIILLLLALFGFLSQWKSSFISRGMLVTLVIALLLALGRHLLFFYKLFFNYVPYFDKFRVPMMILTLVFFIVLVGAGYGIQALKSVSKSKEHQKWLYVVLGIGGFLLLISLITYGASDFMTLREKAQGPNQQIQAYQSIRAEITQKGIFNTFIFFIALAVVAFLLIKEKIKAEIAISIILVLQLMDIFPMNTRYFKVHGEFKDVQSMKKNAFKKGDIENEILKDTSFYRVLPFGRLQQSNNWSYYFQSAGGYSPAKLQTIQNVIANNLSYKNGSPRLNWNVLDVLNIKYVLIQQQVDHADLKYIAADQRKNIYAYRYTQSTPRIFPAAAVIDSISQKEILIRMNQSNFNADSIAYLSQPVAAKIAYPDSFSFKISRYTPNQIQGVIFTSSRTFVKFSEMYYPKWKLTIDDQDTKIYQTDHLIRGAVFPEGSHTFKMYFDDQSFYQAVFLSRIGLWGIYLLLLLGLYFQYKGKIHLLRSLKPGEQTK